MSFAQHQHQDIDNIEDLVTTLFREDSANYADILRRLNLPLSKFDPFCSWSSNSYTRNCIEENEEFELILLCWEAGQCTPIHDHGGEECWVKVLQGSFKETVFKVTDQMALKQVSSGVANEGDVTYMVDFMGYHRLTNQSPHRGMSLHLYAKPIRTCKAYDEELKEFVNKDLVYNTVFETEA